MHPELHQHLYFEDGALKQLFTKKWSPDFFYLKNSLMAKRIHIQKNLFHTYITLLNPKWMVNIVKCLGLN